MLNRLRRLFVSLILVILGTMSVCAQNLIQAKGKVIDSEGKPLAGVAVTTKLDQSKRTTTASDGTFSLRVAEKTILVFTLSGKQTVEQLVSDKPMQVTLPVAEAEKKETTSVASMRQATSVKSTYYPLWVIDGVVYKEDKNFNVSDLNSPDAKRVIAASLPGLSEQDIESFRVISDASATALYGQRALGGVISVKTRRANQGINSFTYQTQLTYRAIPSYRDYNILNSQDQMSIFKEMDQGKSMVPDYVTTRGHWGVYGYMYDHMYDYRDGKYTIKNTDVDRSQYLREAERRNTNWFKELFQHSIKHEHTISLASGNQKANYRTSLGATFDPGWSKFQNSQSYYFNLNANFKPHKDWTFGIIANASYLKERGYGDFKALDYAKTTTRTMDPDTYYAYQYTPFNIKHELKNNYTDYKTGDIRLQATLDWQPIRQLRFSTLAGIRYQNQYSVTNRTERSNAAEAYRNVSKTYIRSGNSYLYKPLDDPTALPQIVMPYGGVRTTQENAYERFDLQAKANYNDSFADGKHTLSALAGIEFYDSNNMNEWYDAYGVNYELGYLTTYSPLLFRHLRNQNLQYYKISPTVDRSVSAVGNIEYTYLNRYKANASYRVEGTNQFGRSRLVRWIPTWNAGLSWDISSEGFFANLKPLSSLSTSISYGMSGTVPYVHNSYARLLTLEPFLGDADLIEPGLYIYEPANHDLTYEKMYELNWSVDFGLWDRINASVTLFSREGRDLIDIVRPQGTGGFVNDVYGNAAAMTAKGAEVSLTTQNIHTKNFSWSTTLTYSHSTNKVTKLNTRPDVTALTSSSGAARLGYPLGSIFSIPFYKLDGDGFPHFFYPNGGETLADGRRITSTKGGGQVSWSATDDDQISYLLYSGTTRPTDLGGLSNSFRIKNVSLGVYLVYSFGAVKRLPAQFATSYNDYSVLGKEFNRRWVRPGDEERTNVPAIANDNARQNNKYLSEAYTYYNNSDVRIAKMDYVQLRDISLSYAVPQSFARKLSLSSLNLKLQASNVFLIYADKKFNGALPYGHSPHSYIFTCTLGL